MFLVVLAIGYFVGVKFPAAGTKTLSKVGL